MSYPVNIAVDCMGGDDDASFVLPGLLLTLKKYPNIKLQLYGDEEIIGSRISKYRALERVSQIIHCDTYVKMDEKPSVAIPITLTSTESHRLRVETAQLPSE